MKNNRLLMIAHGDIASINGYWVRILQEARLLENHAKHLFIFVSELGPEKSKNFRESSLFRELTDVFDHITCAVAPKFLFGFGLVHAGKSLRGYIKDRDIGVIYAQSTSAGTIASLAGLRRPYILDLHGFSFHEVSLRCALNNRSWLYTVLAKLWSFMVDRISISMADHVIAVSSTMKSNLVNNYGIKSTNCSVIPCLVGEGSKLKDIELWKQERKKIRQSLKVEENEVLIGYAGGLGTYQAIPEMILLMEQIAESIKNSKFLILATGDTAPLKILVSSSTILSKLVVLENIDQPLVKNHLAGMDFGLIIRHDDPVNHYACPTKFGEYLGAGLPIICSRKIGDFDSLLKKTGLGIPLAQIQSVTVEESKQIIAMNQDREKIASEAIKWTEADYSWQAFRGDYNVIVEQA